MISQFIDINNVLPNLDHMSAWIINNIILLLSLLDEIIDHRRNWEYGSWAIISKDYRNMIISYKNKRIFIHLSIHFVHFLLSFILFIFLPLFTQIKKSSNVPIKHMMWIRILHFSKNVDTCQKISKKLFKINLIDYSEKT